MRRALPRRYGRSRSRVTQRDLEELVAEVSHGTAGAYGVGTYGGNLYYVKRFTSPGGAYLRVSPMLPARKLYEHIIGQGIG